MRRRALARAAGAARDGDFGTAMGPLALFTACGGEGRAAAFGGGDCFLLLDAVRADAFFDSFSSSSSPPPSSVSVFFWTPGQKAVVLPPTLIQRIAWPSCVALCFFSSQR